MPSKSTFKYILPIFISLAAVFAYHYFLRASVPPKVSFTADTILSLSGLADGDLYIAQNSACDSFDVSGKNLTVSSIPDGSNFILKTAKHNNALRISSSGGGINLDFSSDNFLSGDIASWTISNSGSSAVADVIWGVPKADTRYLVKANGSSFGSFSSGASSEITFRYNLLSSTNFTLETDKGSSTFIKPQKPDVSKVIIAASGNKTLAIYNLPINVDQVAVSFKSNFSNISWEKIVNFGITDKYQNTDKLYIKFRSKEGGASDVVTWERNGADIQEGDIVKTSNNPDVYILKYQGGKAYRRLILSPSVFNSYGHLKWENIKTVSEEEVEKYTLSQLVQVRGDTNIYVLSPAGDTGERRILNTPDYDKNSVYEINSVDRDSYVLK